MTIVTLLSTSWYIGNVTGESIVILKREYLINRSGTLL